MTVAGIGWFPTQECAFDEVLEDVMPDIVRLMKSVASGCTDAKNVSLHFDELIDELHLKLAQVLNNRTITIGSFFSRQYTIARNSSMALEQE
jgi:hypothetical protein